MNLNKQGRHTFHHLRASPLRHGFVLLKYASSSMIMAFCCVGVVFQTASKKTEAGMDGLGTEGSDAAVSSL